MHLAVRDSTRRYHATIADPDRTRDVAHLLVDLRAWAMDHPDIRAVAIAGSWAHGDARMDSDVDIVVLSTNPARYVDALDWSEELGELDFVRRQSWGELTEIRFRLSDGLELEFGFADTSWAATDPIDPGTFEVVDDGISVLFDPDQLLAHLQRAVYAAHRAR